MDPQELGLKIKSRREELGLSQNDLAIELRIPQGKISQIEKGQRRIELLTELPALAKALDRPLGWFVGLEENTVEALTFEELIKKWAPRAEYTETEIRQITAVVKGIIEGVLKNYESVKPSEEERKHG